MSDQRDAHGECIFFFWIWGKRGGAGGVAGAGKETAGGAGGGRASKRATLFFACSRRALSFSLFTSLFSFLSPSPPQRTQRRRTNDGTEVSCFCFLHLCICFGFSALCFLFLFFCFLFLTAQLEKWT
jgi:hypothetical protein